MKSRYRVVSKKNKHWVEKSFFSCIWKRISVRYHDVAFAKNSLIYKQIEEKKARG